MAVISIVGTSGVGKSFLVKQLAAMECLPAFFEGEEGVIPEIVLKNIFAGNSPLKRWRWFIERNKKRLQLARKISDCGIDCYVDGAVMTSEAILADEQRKHHPELLKIIEGITHLKSDLLVLLIASEKKLREFIAVRGRRSEATNKAIARALRIQNEFIRLAKKEKDVIIIDRSKLDFNKEKDLKHVLEIIRKH